MKNLNLGIQKSKYCNILIILSCFCVFSLTTNATTYYVSNWSGDDDSAGTSTNNPWLTIQKAADTAVAGDTVYIKAADYGDENIVFPRSGTSSAPITFEGYENTPGDNPAFNYTSEYIMGGNTIIDPYVMPLLDGGDRATGGVAFTFDVSYIILRNIQIRNYNHGAKIRTTASNGNIVENVIVTDIGDIGDDYNGYGIIVYSGASNNFIKRCIVANACAEGISIEAANYNTIENCQVYSFGNTTAAYVDYALEPEHPLTAATYALYASMDYHITIKDGSYNKIIGCYAERGANEAHNGHGLHIKGNAEYNLIKDSVMVNSSEGISVRHQGVKYNIFENCTAYGYDSESLLAEGISIRDGASYNTFKNCRTIGCGEGVTIFDTGEDEEGCTTAGQYNKIINCIFEDSTTVIRFSGYPHGAWDNEFINCTFDGGINLFMRYLDSYNTTLTNCIVTGVTNLSIGSATLGYEITYSNFYDGFSMPIGTGNFSSCST